MLFGLRVGADIERNDDGAGGFRQRNVGGGDAADGPVDDARLDLVVAELFEGGVDRLDRALHVALDDEKELLHAALRGLLHHLLERAAGAGADQP